MAADQRLSRRNIGGALGGAALRVIAIAQAILSPLGLQIAMLVLLACAACGDWVRCPLSPGLPGFCLTWQEVAAPAELADMPRGFQWHSIGAVLLAATAGGTWLTIQRPGRFGHVAGTLLVLGVAANAACHLNHPFLLDAVSDESAQRARIVSVLRKLNENTLANDGNGWMDATHKNYHAGSWFIALCALGVITHSRPVSFVRRCIRLGLWVGAGSALALALCWPRLLSEVHLQRARVLLMRGEYADSRRALDEAVNFSAALRRQEQFLLLYGELDYYGSLSTPQSHLWQATQYASMGRDRRAIHMLEDVAPAAGETIDTGKMIARIWSQLACEHLSKGEYVAAEEASRQSLGLRSRLDSLLCLGMARARLDSSHPQAASVELKRFVDHCQDPLVRADVLNVIGDAHFEAAQFAAARYLYRRSVESFNFVGHVNLRAQRALGGQ